MRRSAAEKSALKRRAAHELRELLVIFGYLAFFFCALATYRMVVLDEFHIKSWNYTFALINALVVTKVIMLGEYAKVGRRYEHKALLLSSVYKAFWFCLLVLAFHVTEEAIKRFLHRSGVAAAPRAVRIEELLGLSVVIFATFIPLFAYREVRRVLGEEKTHALLFQSAGENK